MGTQDHPWHFILSVVLCTMMALEGRDATTATESHVNVSWSTNNNRRGPEANRNVSMAEPNTQTAHSLLGTLLSLSTMRMVGGEGMKNTTAMWEGSASGMPDESDAEGSAFPTPGTGTTTPGMGTKSATTSSPTLSSATTSHSSSSPSSGTTKARLPPILGNSTETWTAELSSTALPQGQPTGQGTATPSPTGSPSPSVTKASLGSSATISPGEGDSSTMDQGSGMTAEPSVGTSHSLPHVSLPSPSTTMMVGGEGRTETTPTTAAWRGSSLGVSPGSGAVSSAFPTTVPGTITLSTATGSGTASSLTFSSAVTSRSSSSSSPEGFPAVTPNPQQSSTSSTTGMLFLTTSHPPTARTDPVAPASTSSPASGTTVPSHSPTLGSSTETLAPRHSSTALTQGQPTGQGTATPSPTFVTTASVGSSATIPPGEGENSTMNQGSRTTAEPTAKTSHSLPSPSLATPSTTNLSTSTSVNPSFTGTCLPVSIEVQNVTEEEIHLSWTSNSKGSLYLISVMDGKGINKTTTEEKKAVFKNLLPGHVYNISVAESTCAEDNQSSVSVRTDPDSCFERTEFCSAESTGCSDLKDIACANNQAFFCTISFKDQIFNNTLYNSDSEGYKRMSKSIETDIVEGMRAELGNDHFNIFLLGFRSGSVVADFLSLLPKDKAVDDITTPLSTVLRNKFGDQAEVTTVKSLSVQSPTTVDNSSSWRVAVIVLGVLLGVALVLILLAIVFYIYASRRSGKYLVEPSGLIGMFVYKHL